MYIYLQIDKRIYLHMYIYIYTYKGLHVELSEIQTTSAGIRSELNLAKSYFEEALRIQSKVKQIF
jgi:hypothetical protein